jgi:L-rhamnose isomerase
MDFDYALRRYGDLGVDAGAAAAALRSVPISLHCWQGDDVGGFEAAGGELGGGIAATGNYPGKARDPAELRADLAKALSLIPGKHRVNLHAIYGDFAGRAPERDRVEPGHFAAWLDWAKREGLKLDFNATLFSHPLAESGFTLSSADAAVRAFWVRHVKACRRIAAGFGAAQGGPAVHNLWIPDGAKDYPADRMGYRTRLKASLDEIFAEEFPAAVLRDAVEAKLFGLGSEAFVVGSHEFYLGYALTRNKLVCLDMGHFHPTESIADKLSAIFQFQDEVLLHVSRPMRWDSDHVVLFDDELRAVAAELVRSGKLGAAHIALDFFDASINRIGAWALGARSTLKALLYALLEPRAKLLAAEAAGDGFSRLALFEEMKTLPFGAVWDEYCRQAGVPTDRDLAAEVLKYEADVLRRR